MPDDSPALRFLDRSLQLSRLQGHILAKMYADTAAEQEAFSKVEVKTAEDVPKMLALLLPDLERSKERFADIPLMLQLFLARHVDNFQSFLEEVVRRILQTQPNILKDTEDIPIKVVLGYATMEDFVAGTIEARIHAWAYKSIRGFNKAVGDLANFRMLQGEANIKRIEALYDIRNLFTHNYGIVNAHYLSRHPDSKAKVGDTLVLSLEDLKEAWEAVTRAAADIEKRARTQFKWPGGA